VLRAPELDAGLQVGSDRSGAEGQNPLSCPAGLNVQCIFGCMYP